jgi:hypothetical protein
MQFYGVVRAFAKEELCCSKVCDTLQVINASKHILADQVTGKAALATCSLWR